MLKDQLIRDFVDSIFNDLNELERHIDATQDPTDRAKLVIQYGEAIARLNVILDKLA